MEYVAQLIGFQSFSLKRVFAPFGDFVLHLQDHFVPHYRNNYHPHILGHRSLALISVLLVAVKIFTLSVVSLSPAGTALSSAITSQNIISLTNESRSAFGLQVLVQSPGLTAAAQAKAEDMLEKGYFSHNTPEGSAPWEFIKQQGYSYVTAGENLAVNFTQSEDVEQAWMNSPGHKANILNESFEEIGIGIAQGVYQGSGAIFVVQMFATPIEQKVLLSDEPTKVLTEEVPRPAVGTAPNDQVSTQADLNENPVPLPQVLSVKSGEIKVGQSKTGITAQVEGPAVKVLAYLDKQVIMLSPKGGDVWSGEMDFVPSGQSSNQVKVKAYDMKGDTSQLQLANFSQNLESSYGAGGSTPVTQASFLNRTFDPKSFEAKFYLMVIAGVLSCLVLAIALKRHVQHVSLIANSSFVAIFAALLFWTS